MNSNVYSGIVAIIKINDENILKDISNNSNNMGLRHIAGIKIGSMDKYNDVNNFNFDYLLTQSDILMREEERFRKIAQDI